MIYFLVNNTFHWYEVDRFANEIKYRQLGLIQVPYSLKPVESDDRFREVISVERLPFIFEYIKSFPRHLLPLVKANQSKIRIVRNSIRPNKKDILFVFTEAELLNQIIINRFKRSRAKICLVEDGTASAIFYNIPSNKLSKRAIFIKWFIRIYYGIKGFNPYNAEGYFYSMMADCYFSGACFFLPTSIKRKIPIFIIRKPGLTRLDYFNKDYALFLNEPIYNSYTDFETYIRNLQEIISSICQNFKKVYFKFHPDEINSGIYLKISEALVEFREVEIVKTTAIIEDIISEFKVKIVISYFSSALKNLLFLGMEPVYIFHLIDFLKSHGNLKQLKLYLESLNYNFVGSIAEIKSEYTSGLHVDMKNGYDMNQLIHLLETSE